MKIPSISFNLFKSQSVKSVSENQQNPFVANNTNNPFAGNISADVFQNSSINNTQPSNFFVQKSAELISGWNNGLDKVKNQAKEFFAPAVSFAGNLRNGFNKINDMNLGDMLAGIKKEISLLSLDKDVRKYVKMPVSELRTQLAQELTM